MVLGYFGDGKNIICQIPVLDKERRLDFIKLCNVRPPGN